MSVGQDILGQVRRLTLYVMLLFIGLMGCSSHLVPVLERSSVDTRPLSGLHHVQRGETLYAIAWQYGLNYKTLADINAIKSPFIITPGQRLRLTKLKKPLLLKERGDKSKSERSKKAIAVKSSKTKRSVQKASVALNWVWPAQGSVLAGFSAAKSGLRKVNNGIDIGGRLGDPVKASSSGKVVYAGNGLAGYGKLIIIKHKFDYLSAYAHNQKMLVSEGQTVKVGERIAELGSSSNNVPRLHFEIRREGKPVNPLVLLPRR